MVKRQQQHLGLSQDITTSLMPDFGLALRTDQICANIEEHRPMCA